MHLEAAVGARRELRWTALAVLITGLGAALRFYHLGARSYWFDEALSITYARLPVTQFLHLLWAPWVNINMALYYVLLRGWLQLGSGEAVVRALSALFAIATLPLVYLVGRRIYDPATGALAALLLALNAFHLRYSQEARAYSLEILLVTAATLLLLRAVEQRTQGAWTKYAVCAAAAVYAHVLAGLVVVAHALWLLGRRRKLDLGHVRHAFSLFVALIFAAMVCAVHAGTASVQWVAPLSTASVESFFVLIAGNGVAVCYVAAGLWIAGLIASVTGRAPRDAGIIWAWLLAPIAMAAAVSLAHPVFIPRYLVFCVPAAALATAAGVRALGRRPVMLAAAVLVVALTAARAPSAYSELMGSMPDDYRDATEYVLRAARPGDALFFYPGPSLAGYEVYRGHRPGPEVISPVHDDPLLNYMPQPLAEFLPGVPMDHPRVFLVLGPLVGTRDLGQDVVQAWLRRHYRLESGAQFQGIRVLTYVK